MNAHGNRMITAVFAAALLAVFSGCGGDGASHDGLTITGTVWDLSASTLLPAGGVTVTLRGADNGAITATTTANDGSYTLTNVPASRDQYINVWKTDYAGFNSEVINISADVPGKELWIASAANVKYTADLIYPHTGTTSSWSDPFYSDQCWFTLDIFDASGTEAPGVTITAAGLSVLYNNGADVFLPAGPTSSLLTHTSAPLIGGYDSSSRIYTFTLTNGTITKTMQLPLVPGEMTYVAVYPW